MGVGYFAPRGTRTCPDGSAPKRVRVGKYGTRMTCPGRGRRRIGEVGLVTSRRRGVTCYLRRTRTGRVVRVCRRSRARRRR